LNGSFRQEWTSDLGRSETVSDQAARGQNRLPATAIQSPLSGRSFR